MKNKLLLTACLLYLFNIASQAAPVTPNVAKQQAAIFLTQLSANSQANHITCGKHAAHAHVGIHRHVGQRRS